MAQAHPYFETAKQAQFAAFQEEIAAFVAFADNWRAKLSARRILPELPASNAQAREYVQ